MRLATGLGFVSVLLALLLAWELASPERAPDTSPARLSEAGTRVGPDTGPAIGTGRVTEAGKTPSPGMNAGALAQIADTIKERPLFVPGRRPAQKPATATAAAGTAASRELPRLTGVMVGPRGGVAIFALPDGKSRRAITGDTIGEYKIREISPGQVTLTGANGVRVMRPAYVAAQGSTAAAPTQGNPR